MLFSFKKSLTVTTPCCWWTTKTFPLLLLLPLVLVSVSVSTSHAQLCQDSKTFKFPLLNVIEKRQDCAWILKSSNEDRRKKRKEKYCPLAHIKYACPLSCDACDESCEDNPFYLFQNENGETKNCAWIQQDDVELRRMIYCYAHDSMSGTSNFLAAASEIGENCAASCGFCKGDFGLVPSEVDWEELGVDIGGDDNEVGISVTMSEDGKVVAVGFIKSVDTYVSYVYRLFHQCQNTKWCQIGTDIRVNTISNANFGVKNMENNALSKDGKTFAVQTRYNYVSVYQWNGFSWEQIDGGSMGFDGIVISRLSMSGDGKVVSLFLFSTFGTPMGVRVYGWDGSSWKEFNLDLVAADEPNLNTVTGQITEQNQADEVSYELIPFSASLSDDGSVLAILSAKIPTLMTTPEEEILPAIVFVQVYEWTGFSWCQKGEHIMLKTNAFDFLGLTNVVLSGDGNVLAIGPDIILDDTQELGPSRKRLRTLYERLAQDESYYFPAESSVSVYEWNDESWSKRGLDFDGNSVVVDNVLDEGAIATMTLSGDGKVLVTELLGRKDIDLMLLSVVYHWDGSSWNQMGTNILVDGSANFSPFFSVSSNYDGTIVAFGGTPREEDEMADSPLEDTNTTSPMFDADDIYYSFDITVNSTTQQNITGGGGPGGDVKVYKAVRAVPGGAHFSP